jgi:hypothetical protein
MTKKNFIELADMIREYNKYHDPKFDIEQICILAHFLCFGKFALQPRTLAWIHRGHERQERRQTLMAFLIVFGLGIMFLTPSEVHYRNRRKRVPPSSTPRKHKGEHQ